MNLLDPDLIVAAALAHGAQWEKTNGLKHIFYVEGCNLDGARNDNRIDKWNDIRGIIEFKDGNPELIFKCQATTVPGIYYDRTHIIGWGGKGAALIALGSQKAWQVGFHQDNPDHPCLRQTGGAVSVYRDVDKNLTRKDGYQQSGWYGINHHGCLDDASPSTIGPHSAGCLVARLWDDGGHLEFMRLVKQDPRYQADHSHVFDVIVMSPEWIDPSTMTATHDYASSGLGSWYSQYSGKYEWVDRGDEPGSNALGVPDDAQGIAFYNRATLGKWFEVEAPNGAVSIEQQTDIGPAPRTGRDIDISAAAGERFGYSPRNFPTDESFSWKPVEPPRQIAGLSPQKQATAYRDMRKNAPSDDTATTQPTQPNIVVLPPPQQQQGGLNQQQIAEAVAIAQQILQYGAQKAVQSPQVTAWLASLIGKLAAKFPMLAAIGWVAYSVLDAIAKYGATDIAANVAAPGVLGGSVAAGVLYKLASVQKQQTGDKRP